MVVFINMYFSVSSYAQQLLCCRFYQVTLDTLENCYILVKVENIDPNCHGAHVFQYYNPVTQQYETKHVEHDEPFYSEFLHGSQIFSREFTNANKQFDLNTLNLNSGVYFYSILVDGKIVKTEKLIIVK